MRNGTDGTIIHPGVVEKDSGQVALVAIVIVSLVLVIVGLVSELFLFFFLFFVNSNYLYRRPVLNSFHCFIAFGCGEVFVLIGNFQFLMQ